MAEAEAHATWEFPDSQLLIIDDAAENRELLTLVLNDLGLNTDTAENGAIGVEMAKAKHYDVILSDIQMPVMDGYEAVAAMRDAGLEQPIIALTANAMKGYEERILSAGFSHYMSKPIDIDALSKLLADLLNGKRVEKAEPAKTNSAPVTDAIHVAANDSDGSPIYSRLAGSEKLAPVVEKFISRVHEQFTLMQDAHTKEDFEELAGLAHWLKGSGGTIGFDQLSKPAKTLEDSARASNQEDCGRDLQHIKSIIDRLRVGTDPNAEGTAAKVTSVTQESDQEAVDVVESTLLVKNPSFRPIVMKFLPRLKSQIEAMDEAVSKEDYDELAALAHWLKGSGGAVGFDVFPKPAATMEASAKSKDMVAVTACLEKIRNCASKIVITGNDGDSAIDQSA